MAPRRSRPVRRSGLDRLAPGSSRALPSAPVAGGLAVVGPAGRRDLALAFRARPERRGPGHGVGGEDGPGRILARLRGTEALAWWIAGLRAPEVSAEIHSEPPGRVRLSPV